MKFRRKKPTHVYWNIYLSTRGTESTEVTEVRQYIHTQESVPCDFLYMMYRCQQSYSMLLDTALHRQWLGGSFLSACIFLFLNLRAYLQGCVQFVKIQEAAFLRPTPVFRVVSSVTHFRNNCVLPHSTGQVLSWPGHLPTKLLFLLRCKKCS